MSCGTHSVVLVDAVFADVTLGVVARERHWNRQAGTAEPRGRGMTHAAAASASHVTHLEGIRKFETLLFSEIGY